MLLAFYCCSNFAHNSLCFYIEAGDNPGMNLSLSLPPGTKVLHIINFFVIRDCVQNIYHPEVIQGFLYNLRFFSGRTIPGNEAAFSA